MSKVNVPYTYGYLTELQCPLCGHRLYREGDLVWCSHVSFRGDSCHYGIGEDVTLEQHMRRIRSGPQALKRPDSPGFWIFNGVRHTAGGSYIKSVRDICEVVSVPAGPTNKLIAYFFRRSTPVVIDLLEGEFTRVDLNFGGKRLRD